MLLKCYFLTITKLFAAFFFVSSNWEKKSNSMLMFQAKNFSKFLDYLTVRQKYILSRCIQFSIYDSK